MIYLGVRGTAMQPEGWAEDLVTSPTCVSRERERVEYTEQGLVRLRRLAFYVRGAATVAMNRQAVTS